MSRGKELAKNTAILTFGKICTQFVSFLLLPLYTAILEPEVYGISDLFNSYIYLIIPLVSLMLDQGLFRFLLDCRDDIKRQKKLFSTVLCINLIEILVYAVFYILLQNHIQSEFKIFLFIDVCLNVLLNTFMQFSRGIGQTGVYAFTSFLSASSMVVSNVVLLAILKIGAWGLFISTVISRSISLIAIVIMLKSWKYFSIKNFSVIEAKKLMKYSFPFIPNQLSWWVIGASDRTIISKFISIAANGLYSVANKFSSIYITFYNIFNLSWTESVSLHINDEDAEEYLKTTINTLFSVFFAFCVGIIAYMPLVFPILINEQYNAAYYQIPILMIAVLFQIVVGLYSVIYVALKKSKEIAKTSFYAAVINIFVDVVLIKYIGLYAASLSTLVAYGTMAIYRYFHVKKYMDISLDNKMQYLFVMFLVNISYYHNGKITNYVTAIIITIYAIIANREFVLSCFKMVVTTVEKMWITIKRKKSK